MRLPPKLATRMGARTRQPSENIEIVAHLVEEIGAAPFLLAPPVARQIPAMLRRQMFGRVHRDKLAELAGIHARDGLAHDRHGAHHQADMQRRNLFRREVARQREGFLLGAHDRLLGEDRIARLERG